MKTEPAAVRALHQARAHYEVEGFTVTLDARLPAPFEGFVADALARRGAERVIVEVRPNDMRNGTRDRLKRLAEIVSAEQGWRVDLVTFEPEAVPPPLDNGDVVRRVGEARSVARLSPEAGVSLLGSAVAGALRTLDLRRDKHRRRLTPTRLLIRELTIDGLLSDQQAEKLDKFARIHDHVMNGLASPSFDPEALEWPAAFALAVAEERFTPIEDMTDWFRRHYEPPELACLPYDSEEGRYIWLDRGPYQPEQVLDKQFEGSLEADLAEAAEIIKDEGGIEWARRNGP